MSILAQIRQQASTQLPHMTTSFLEEFKPRKAKFGMKAEEVRLEHLTRLGDLVRELEHRFEPDTYTIEFGVPFKARTVKFKVYTDYETIISHIKGFIANAYVSQL